MFGLNNESLELIDGYLNRGVKAYADDRGLEVDHETVASVMLSRFTRRRARHAVLNAYAAKKGVSIREAARMLNDDPAARDELVAMEIDWSEMMSFLLQLLEIFIKLM